MESQFRPGFDGMQGVRGYHVAAPPPSSTPVPLPGYILRGIAVVLTFISAIVMGAAKEDVIMVVEGAVTTTSFNTSIKSTNSAAYVYFIVANVLVFVYTLISLVISIANRAGSSRLEMPLAIADLLIIVLLFSSNGAAIAIDVVAEHGQTHLGWDKFCDAVHKFCAHVTASIVLSMIASLAYVMLVILAMVGLHQRSQ